MMRFMFLLMMLISLSACAVQDVNLKVTVSDGDDNPVEGALVKGFFFQDQVVDKQQKPEHQDMTDSDGIAELSGREEIHVDLKVTKPGYYGSKKRVIVRNRNDQDVHILLREIRHPIALYAKHFKGYLTEKNKKIGFDFGKGDWVHPYGKGLSADIYFFYQGFTKSIFDYEGNLTISFPGDQDGLADLEFDDGRYSEFRFPYLAPENGYRKTKTLIHKRFPKGNSSVKNSNLNKKNNFGYFIRIKSEVNSAGDIVQANYVKISGEIVLDPRSEGKGAAYLEFKYYYNPVVNDKNVEFNPKWNLFKNLKRDEKVTAP